MIKILSLMVAWLLLATSSIAGQQEYTTVLKAFPEASDLEISAGLLDGKQHLAALVKSNQSTFAIAIFTIDKDGSYKLLAKSKWLDTHIRWFNLSAKIRNGSVYLSFGGSGGCCFDYFNQYQFVPHDNKFVLAGTESTTTGTEEIDDGNAQAIGTNRISYRSGLSINYLTGEILHWRVQAASSNDDKAFKDDILRIKKGKKRIEKLFRFTPKEATQLEQFDMWAESNTLEKHMSGYFDQNFKYHE